MASQLPKTKALVLHISLAQAREAGLLKAKMETMEISEQGMVMRQDPNISRVLRKDGMVNPFTMIESSRATSSGMKPRGNTTIGGQNTIKGGQMLIYRC
jgi:hypothetical protein